MKAVAVLALFVIGLMPRTAGAGKEDADPQLVQSILQEIELVPFVYARGEAPIKVAALPKFSAVKLASYASGARDESEAERKRWMSAKTAYAKTNPLRAAIFETTQENDTLRKLTMPMMLPSGVPVPKQKANMLQVQMSLAIALFKLEQAHQQMEEAAEKRAKEKNLRWKADFDFALARVRTNLVYLWEYDFTIGQVRADNLPKLEMDQNGWKIAPRPKISVPEAKAKALLKTRSKHLQKIQEEHAGTPWSYFAERESKRDLGMEWVGKKK